VTTKRGGRRPRVRMGAEFRFVQSVIIRCPMVGHKMGIIRRDWVQTKVLPEFGDDNVRQDLRRIDGRLFGSCVKCWSELGIRGTYQVRWDRVEGLLDRMRTHGPHKVTVPLVAKAIDAAALRPHSVSDRW
jgi:hypothetical protein